MAADNVDEEDSPVEFQDEIREQEETAKKEEQIDNDFAMNDDLNLVIYEDPAVAQDNEEEDATEKISENLDQNILKALFSQ